jgi:predicted amidohydrolase
MESQHQYSLLIGVVAMGADPWALEENFQRLEEYVREAARRRAQVVIAPEGVLDGYVCCAAPDVTREKMLAVAQEVPDGPYLRRAAALSRWYDVYAFRVGLPEQRRIAILFYDITKRKHDEERLALLATEVDHRAKNMLAVVTSMVTRMRT